MIMDICKKGEFYYNEDIEKYLTDKCFQGGKEGRYYPDTIVSI